MNLYFVDTPHQLFNAIEARQSFDEFDNRVVIMVSRPYPFHTFDMLLRDHTWTSTYRNWPIEINKMGGASTLSRWYRSVVGFYNEYGIRKMIDLVVCDITRVKRIFLGNYGQPHMKHLANRIRAESIYLLDDGTATIAINEERRKRKTVGARAGRSGWRYRLRTGFLGFDLRPIENVVFFTAYDLLLADGDEIVRNDYRYFRGRSEKLDGTEDVYFIGQPMVEDGLMTLEDFTSHLERVKRHLAGKSVLYLPHKRERLDKVRTIQDILGFRTMSFDVPIEYQMSVRGPRPKILASFFSSALENSRIIFGRLMQIKCFRINPEDFMTRREDVSLIYAYYASKQSESFEIID